MYNVSETVLGVLTPTLQPVCNWFATRKKKLKSQSGCKGRGKVFFKSPTSRRLKSVASCLLKGVLTPTLQPGCNWFATRKKLKSRRGCKGRGKVFFKSPTSRRLKSVASCLLNMHKRLAATEFDREEVA